ncbi:MAG: ATP-binding cassette domain-containing protein, partial [Bacteroidota bacterium]
SFTNAFYNIQKGMAAVDRIDKILEADAAISSPAQPVPLDGFYESIEYRKLSFWYQPHDRKILDDINLTIRKGQLIALVGASGAGKTTLADLLPRFYDPQQGGIYLDGTDIRQFDLHQLRSLMGIVSQEAILFNDSIYNNIVFGLNGVTKAQVEEAAKIANAHDFIMATEQGYDTNIGDRGNKLSGGQRQRIAIARAILKNPPILILDEATSALDAESEQLVRQALTKVMANRTAIVIAHRLSTIQDADEILVLREGRIIERGRHEALLQKHGEYQKLVELQAF